MSLNNIKNKINSIFFTKSSFVSTFVIYITIMFVSVISYIELRKNLIPEVTLNFLLILEVHIILIFILSYLGLFNSLKSNKWINFAFSVLFFVASLFIIYQTVVVLITQTSSFNNYSFYLFFISGLLFVQNYFDDRKAKNYLLSGAIITFVFLIFNYVINYVFGNPLLEANQFIVSQKQVNDSVLFFSIVYLLYLLFTLFNVIRIYIPDIKEIDQN
jgi:hypothetical protein